MYVKCKQNLCKISAKSLQNVCKMSTECLSCVCPLFSHYFISQRLSCVPNVWSQISDYFQYFSIHTSQKKIAILKRWKIFLPLHSHPVSEQNFVLTCDPQHSRLSKLQRGLLVSGLQYPLPTKVVFMSSKILQLTRDHVIYLKLFAKLSKFTKWHLKMVLAEESCHFEWK